LETKTVYFDNPGPENTDVTLNAVRERAGEIGISTVVLLSVTGVTAVRAVDILTGLRLIAVTHCTGYTSPGVQEFRDENRQYVTAKGGTVLTVTPVFGGLSAAKKNRLKTLALGDIVASTLTVFGTGMREALESLVTAADSGLVRVGEPVVAVGGTEGGADTAVVCCPVNAMDFWDLRVGEVICKPRFL